MNLLIQTAAPVIIGFALHKLITLGRRDRGSQNTPGNLEFKFWWHDNWVSVVFHITLVVAVILYLPDLIDWAAGYKHTPKQIADVLTGVPAKLLLFAGGVISAMPLTWFEKKLREVKKKLGLMTK
jgi:hypothetical protein